MNLTDFLLARITEDEAVAQAAAARISELDEMWDEDLKRWDWTAWTRPAASFVSTGHVPVHIARWDPARVLAECEAKRRIVTTASQATLLQRTLPDLEVDGYATAMRDVLKLLAAPFAWHPDYRDEWRP